MEYIKKFVAECRVYFAIGWYDAFGVGYRIYIFFLLPKLVVHGRECNFMRGAIHSIAVAGVVAALNR